MKMFVGIDPSINNTGVCVIVSENNHEIVREKFYIIKGSKLTKKESAAEESYIDKLQYIIYDKEDIDSSKNADNHLNELKKTRNFTKIIDAINNIIKSESSLNPVDAICICQEGISYGSTIRTKSVFDLAGLNFMIRYKFINKVDKYIVATPAEIKKFATGKGNAKKDLVILNFKTYYPDLNIPKIDDIADAFFMSKLGKEIYEEDN